MLDDLRDLRRHHLLPRGVLFLDSSQHIARKNVQHALIEIIELLDPAALDQIRVKILQAARHCYVLHGFNFSGGRIAQGINVNPQIFCE